MQVLTDQLTRTEANNFVWNRIILSENTRCSLALDTLYINYHIH